MNFGKNLQAIRKARKLSQEELADKMQISRQAISKWESGTTYPETEKLIELSEVLQCSMDSLAKGEGANVAASPSDIKVIYENLMNKFSKQISLAVMLLLLGSSLLLEVSALSTPYVDYGLVLFLVFVAISVPIFVMRGIELNNFKAKHPQLEEFYTEAEVEAYNSKFIKLVASGVGVILAGLVVFMAIIVTNYFGTESPIAAAVFLLFVTVAAPMLTYAGLQKSKYDIAQYNRKNSARAKAEAEKIGKIAGLIMMLATIIFLLLGFLGRMWALAWLVFPVGGILCGIVAMILQKEN